MLSFPILDGGIVAAARFADNWYRRCAKFWEDPPYCVPRRLPREQFP